MRRLWRRVGLPSAAFAAPPRVTVLSMITLTVAILTGSLVGRPVKNGDAHLKHTATEKTAAVPVAEAESTKVPLRSAGRRPGSAVWSVVGSPWVDARHPMSTPPAAHQLGRADKHETASREGSGITFL